MDVYAAIADPIRRDILSLLAIGPTAAGVVAASFSDISRPAVSRHLRVLREAGLVTSELDGRRQIYTATTSPLGSVITWIDSFSPRLRNQLDALETEVYRTRRERLTNGPRPTTIDTTEEHTA